MAWNTLETTKKKPPEGGREESHDGRHVPDHATGEGALGETLFTLAVVSEAVIPVR